MFMLKGRVRDHGMEVGVIRNVVADHSSHNIAAVRGIKDRR